MNNFLNEDKRQELVASSKRAQRERDNKTRYEKRLKSRVSNNVKQYNRIDMNSLFKQDILTVYVEVRGETDNYLVGISYGGILEALKEEIRRNNDTLELRNIIRALIIAFNRNDVYLRCTCPDWKYRFNYWATKNKINFGEPELRPSDETNPHNDLGPACKHVLLVLSNTSWIIKVASVINNYIKYMKDKMQKAYASIIYPAVYGKKYEEPVQSTMFDDEQDELTSDEETIDTSNIAARKRGQFQAGNKYRFQKQDRPIKGQIEIEDTEEEGDNR